MEIEGALKDSIAQFYKSVYGVEEVNFVDVFEHDVSEEDQKGMLSVVSDSLSHIPSTFKGKLISQFLKEHPELKQRFEEDEDESKEIEIETSSALEMLHFLPLTEFDEEFEEESQSLTESFTICDADRLLEMVQKKRHPYFELARIYAIQKLGNDINSSVHAHHKLNKCKTDIKIADYEHFHIFSWLQDRFVARRQMKGIAWVDIFQKSLTEPCMEAFKLQVDVIELVRLLKPILLSFYAEDKKFVANARRTITAAYNLLNMHNKIERELEESIALFCEKINALTNTALNRGTEGRDIVKNYLEQETMAARFRDPIVLRYQLNYAQDRVADWQDYLEIKEGDLKLELKKAKQKKSIEMYRYRCTLQSMYVTIEDCKGRLATMTEEYDRRLNEANETNAILKINLGHMKMQREFYETERKYMKAKVRKMLEREASEAMEMKTRLEEKPSQLPPLSRSKTVSRMNTRNEKRHPS
ncbi:uncharacterized protein LOC129249285 [Anastrepha obliqua]|uniref:uncharacterized protein LOC129249285 n=1 Tax=Anastrepha obliqua TaxID=95512 RepID=UPI00240A88E1|nr:uncharacterized protein LOC129249285 [Anastrepha obliqua]